MHTPGSLCSHVVSLVGRCLCLLIPYLSSRSCETPHLIPDGAAGVLVFLVSGGVGGAVMSSEPKTEQPGRALLNI